MNRDTTLLLMSPLKWLEWTRLGNGNLRTIQCAARSWKVANTKVTHWTSMSGQCVSSSDCALELRSGSGIGLLGFKYCPTIH